MSIPIDEIFKNPARITKNNFEVKVFWDAGKFGRYGRRYDIDPRMKPEEKKEKIKGLKRYIYNTACMILFLYENGGEEMFLREEFCFMGDCFTTPSKADIVGTEFYEKHKKKNYLPIVKKHIVFDQIVVLSE